MDESKFIFIWVLIAIVSLISILAQLQFQEDENSDETSTLLQLNDTTQTQYECPDQSLNYTLFNQIDEVPDMSKFLLENLPTRLIRFC